MGSGSFGYFILILFYWNLNLLVSLMICVYFLILNKRFFIFCFICFSNYIFIISFYFIYIDGLSKRGSRGLDWLFLKWDVYFWRRRGVRRFIWCGNCY